LFPATQFACCTRKTAQKKKIAPSLALTKRMALPTPKLMALTKVIPSRKCRLIEPE
jgi:hypothetical protein